MCLFGCWVSYVLCLLVLRCWPPSTDGCFRKWRKDMVVVVVAVVVQAELSCLSALCCCSQGSVSEHLTLFACKLFSIKLSRIYSYLSIRSWSTFGFSLWPWFLYCTVFHFSPAALAKEDVRAKSWARKQVNAFTSVLTLLTPFSVTISIFGSLLLTFKYKSNKIKVKLN